MGFFCFCRPKRDVVDTDGHVPTIASPAAVALQATSNEAAADQTPVSPSPDAHEAISSKGNAAGSSSRAGATASEDASPSGCENGSQLDRAHHASIAALPEEARTASYWDLALLQLKEKHPALWSTYEAVVAERSGIDLPGLIDQKTMIVRTNHGLTLLSNLNKLTIVELQETVEAQLERTSRRRWKMKVPFRDAPIEIRDLVQRLAGLAQAIKGLWSTVSSVNPIMVGLPLAGLSTVIEVGTTVTSLRDFSYITSMYLHKSTYLSGIKVRPIVYTPDS